jgi:hypothetical protein
MATIRIDDDLLPIVKLGLDVLAGKASNSMAVAAAAMKYISDSESRERNQKIYDDNYSRLRQCDSALRAIEQAEV